MYSKKNINLTELEAELQIKMKKNLWVNNNKKYVKMRRDNQN